MQPAENKAIVRFKESNSATVALEKLTKVFDDGKIMYKDCHLTGRVIEGGKLLLKLRLNNLSIQINTYFLLFLAIGDEELQFWEGLLAVLRSKKRKGGRQDVC